MVILERVRGGIVGIPPSQGGKYVGFGSTPPPVPRNNSQGDILSSVTQGFGRLSVVATSAAESAANVVQAVTKEFTSKVLWLRILSMLLVIFVIVVSCNCHNSISDDWQCFFY